MPKQRGLFLADHNAVASSVHLPKIGSAAASRPGNQMPAGSQVPQTRHLLYHIYPRRTGKWRSRILRIRESLPLFNGRRIIAIAYDGTTEHPVMVRDALAGEQIEFLEIRNNPERREVETFRPLFERLEDLKGKEHCTLYAHAKGVTRPREHTADRWIQTIEELYLDHWKVVGDLLTKFPIVGAFKKVGQGWPIEWSRSDWHYAGAWYWFRNDQLFSQLDWKNIDEFWGGIEPYPSLHFRQDEAGTIDLWDACTHVNLYEHNQWETHVEPLVQRFREKHREKRPVVTSTKLNVGCGPYYASGWWNTDLVKDSMTKPDQVVSWTKPFPWEADTFDTVYLGHVLEHVPWDKVIPLLSDLQKVCKSGATICILGPDLKKALDRGHKHKDKQGTLSHYWEILEDSDHHQAHQRDRELIGMRHWWNCYSERLVAVMEAAGLTDVRTVELDSDELAVWPVVDLTNLDQCCVMGTVQ